MTTIDDPRGQVLRIRQTAIACPHVLGAREADAMVDHILYYAIATLRRDQRITQLPLIACELLFVETRDRATEELVRQIAGKAVLRVAVDCIADAILVSRIMIEAIVTLVMSSAAGQISERRSRRS